MANSAYCSLRSGLSLLELILNCAEAVKAIPLERILLETDAPYLAPTPLRGTRNESANIPLIATFLAQVKGISTEEVAKITTRNAEKLFAL